METVKKDALVAGKHYEGEAESISDEHYSMCIFLVKMVIATMAIAALYFVVTGIIDVFEGLMYKFVVATSNPFGWS